VMETKGALKNNEEEQDPCIKKGLGAELATSSNTDASMILIHAETES